MTGCKLTQGLWQQKYEEKYVKSNKLVMEESKEEMLIVALRTDQLRCSTLESTRLGRRDYGLFQSCLLIWLGQNSLWNGLAVGQRLATCPPNLFPPLEQLYKLHFLALFAVMCQHIAQFQPPACSFPYPLPIC